VATAGALGLIRHPKAWQYAATAILAAAVLRGLAPSHADPDLWGHVRYGQDLLRTGQIVRADVYSYTTDQPWINHEWLCEAVFGWLYNVSGSAGLIILRLGIGLLIAWIVYRHLRQHGLDMVWSSMLTLLVILVARSGMTVVRPQMFTYISWLAIMLVIYHADHGRLRWLWLAPVVCALWVNLHGGVLAGIGILGVWATVHLGWDVVVEGEVGHLRSRKTMLIVVAVVASVLSLLLNPFGMKLLVFLVKTATVPRPYITEWQPLKVASLEGGVYTLLFGVALASLFLSTQKRSPALIAAFLCSAALPHSAFRHLGLFAIAAAILNAEHIADTWNRLLPRREKTDALTPAGQGFVVFAFVAAIWYAAMSVPYFVGVRIEVMPFPARAVALLKKSDVDGQMLTYFDWGQYVLWHLGPKIKVSMDGRRETVYSEETYQQDLRFRFGTTEDWDAIMKIKDPQIALVHKEFACFNLMRLKPEWQLVYEDQLCGLFAKKGTSQLEQIRGTPVPKVKYDGVGLCFPGL